MIAEFSAMGTAWWISAPGADGATLAGVRSLVDTEERRFSRFRPESPLSRLNRTGSVTDRRVAEVTRLARRVRRATGGAFDPAIGAAVIGAGYDRTFDELPPIRDAATSGPPPARLACSRHTVRVADGALDLGGIAKGWTVDRAGGYLRERGCEAFVIDAGGDILVSSPDGADEVIGIDDSGWAVRVGRGAVATSSTLRRRWATLAGDAHHIIDPSRGVPAAARFVTATVVAPSAALADALGTALLADVERALPALPRFDAEAFLVDADGEPLMTPGMERWLA